MRNTNLYKTRRDQASPRFRTSAPIVVERGSQYYSQHLVTLARRMAHFGGVPISMVLYVLFEYENQSVEWDYAVSRRFHLAALPIQKICGVKYSLEEEKSGYLGG